jgi:Phosphatidylethanolamine-binding protein
MSTVKGRGEVWMNNQAETVLTNSQHWLQTGLTIGSDSTLTSSDPPVTPYLPCAPGPGPAHRYVFILCQEEPDSGIFDLASKEFESKSGKHDLKDRMGFYAEPFIQKYNMKIVDLTFMRVGPNASALVENMKLGVESVVDKIVGQ